MSNDGLPSPQRYWAITTILIGIVLSVLSEGIAITALPTISQALGASAADSIWVINAYQVAVIAALFPLASLGEILGFRAVYRAGLLVFVVGAVGSTLADTLTTLTAARVVQGLGAAGVMSVNLALVRFIYPTRQLGRGVGLNALFVAMTSAAAPSVASALLLIGPWNWLFAINVPMGLLGLFMAWRFLPESPTSRQRWDVPSAVLNALTFGLLVVGLRAFDGGQGAPLVALALVGSAVSALLLIRRQAGMTAPMLPVDLLRLPVFALSVATSACAFAGYAIALVTMPFFLVHDLGRPQVEAGLLLTPWPLAVAVAAPLSGWLSDRVASPAVIGSVGMAIFAGGLALLATLPPDPANIDIVWRTTLCGLGFGIFQSPNNKVLITSAPKERSGGVGGIQSTARLLGQTLGAVTVGLMFAHAPDHGAVIAFGVASACGVVACITGGLRPAARTA